MASRNQKFSVPTAHTEALFRVAKAFDLTPTQCLARLLDAAMPDAERILARAEPYTSQGARLSC
jgi:hypothetical protein